MNRFQLRLDRIERTASPSDTLIVCLDVGETAEQAVARALAERGASRENFADVIVINTGVPRNRPAGASPATWR